MSRIYLLLTLLVISLFAVAAPAIAACGPGEHLYQDDGTGRIVDRCLENKVQSQTWAPPPVIYCDPTYEKVALDAAGNQHCESVIAKNPVVEAVPTVANQVQSQVTVETPSRGFLDDLKDIIVQAALVLCGGPMIAIVIYVFSRRKSAQWGKNQVRMYGSGRFP